MIGRAEPLVSRRRQQTASWSPERTLDLPGVEAAARFHRSMRNRRGPPRQPASGKAVRISAEREVARCREGVGGGHSTEEGLETGWREGPLLWSCWGRRYARGHGRKTQLPGSESARTPEPALGCEPSGAVGEVRHVKSDFGGDDLRETWGPRVRRHACHILKTIGKPCAGNPHARFERGSCRSRSSLVIARGIGRIYQSSGAAGIARLAAGPIFAARATRRPPRPCLRWCVVVAL